MARINVDTLMEKGKFATILRCLLSKNMITQSELAKRTGISRATINHYVNGRFAPSQKNLTKISECLGVAPSAFYDEIEAYIPYLKSKDSSFGAQLELLLMKNGITQKELADRIGVSRQVVNYYINGKQYPQSKTLEKLNSIFNMDISVSTNTSVENSDCMRLYVTRMPKRKKECVFSRPHHSQMGSVDCYDCKLNGVCDLEDGMCSHLTVSNNDLLLKSMKK